MGFLLYVYALACGAINPVHSGFNTTLARHMGALRAAAVSSVVATVALTAVVLLRGELRLPMRPGLPWWAWGSGLIEAVIVLSQPVVAPKVGAATYTALLVTASVLMSVVLDQAGALGFAQRAATLGRVAGAGLMVGGMVMVAVL